MKSGFVNKLTLRFSTDEELKEQLKVNEKIEYFDSGLYKYKPKYKL